MTGKKWSLFLILSFVLSLFLIGTTVYVVDPFFHFHAPVGNLSYKLDNGQYMNDGITKNFDYDAIITGTSMTSYMSTEEFDSLFGTNSIRLTFLGEGFRRIDENLQVGLETHPNVDIVLRSIDPIWFISDKDHLGYDEYPDYLYDNNLFNDVHYLFNKDIFKSDVLPEIKRTLSGVPAVTFDQGIDINLVVDRTLPPDNTYKRPDKNDKIVTEEETAEFFYILEESIQANYIDTIEANPDTTFYLFIAPYSIYWWDSTHQNGDAVLQRRIDMEKRAIEMLLPYENVRVFSFSNNFELTCDVYNYEDAIHYHPYVCSQLLQWMKAGEYELTLENYEAYIDEIRTFYSTYDYDALFPE